MLYLVFSIYIVYCIIVQVVYESYTVKLLKTMITSFHVDVRDRVKTISVSICVYMWWLKFEKLTYFKELN